MLGFGSNIKTRSLKAMPIFSVPFFEPFVFTHVGIECVCDRKRCIFCCRLCYAKISNIDWKIDKGKSVFFILMECLLHVDVQIWTAMHARCLVFAPSSKTILANIFQILKKQKICKVVFRVMSLLFCSRKIHILSIFPHSFVCVNFHIAHHTIPHHIISMCAGPLVSC